MKPTLIQRKAGRCTVWIQDESPYADRSENQTITYRHRLRWDAEPEISPSTQFGFWTEENNALVSSCLLESAGGYSVLTERSVLIQEDRAAVAIGNSLCLLSLPDLQLLWHVQADEATCFAAYDLPASQSFITHGELLISRISYDGKVIWQAGGADIFSEGFAIHNDFVEAIDFNNKVYRFSIEDGSKR